MLQFDTIEVRLPLLESSISDSLLLRRFILRRFQRASLRFTTNGQFKCKQRNKGKIFVTVYLLFLHFRSTVDLFVSGQDGQP